MVFWHSGTTLVILWFVFRGNTRLDYRLAILGALLPDIVDKLVGRVLFKSTFENGRIFGHTLLLNVAFFSTMFFLRGRIKRKSVMIPIGALLHLAEDGVWSMPATFWWPLFGWAFPRKPQPGPWWTFAVPGTKGLVQEAVGLVLFLWLFAAHGMLSPKGLKAFIRTGHLETGDRPPVKLPGT